MYKNIEGGDIGGDICVLPSQTICASLGYIKMIIENKYPSGEFHDSNIYICLINQLLVAVLLPFTSIMCPAIL